MSDQDLPPSSSLESWFAAWHPLYRPRLLQLGTYAVLTGLLVYGENVALRELTNSLALSDKALAGDAVLRAFATFARSSGLRLPLLVLASFALLRIGRVVVEVMSKLSAATLSQRARSDLEAQILDHLLRKDDAFFTSRPPAEILNRLSSDIGRVVERRNVRNQQRQSIFLIVGNVYFFLREDWRLALAGVTTCALGVWAMHRLTAPVKEMDRSYLARDDRVKSMFEDFLRASPEVQVAGLRSAVRSRFEVVQDERRSLFLTFTKLSARISVASSAAYLLAFISLCVIPLYFFEDKDANIQLALIPVVLKALPELFANASQLVLQRLTLQLSDTSEKRLLEYDSGALEPDPAGAELPIANASASVVVRDVTYRYRTPEGSLQGGISGVTTVFPENRWTALVGGAGSGKSTLLQLIVGRTRPQGGEVSFGATSYADMSAAQRAEILTLMPQTLAILDGTIGENLRFGRDPKRVLDPDDLTLLERTGLGTICRLKALTMVAGDDVDARARSLEARIGEVRERMRTRLLAEGFTVTPFEAGGRDPDGTVIERLARSRADRAKVVDRLFEPRVRAALDTFAKTPLGGALIARVPAMLEETRALLGLSSYAAYVKLAAQPIDERIWQKRVSVLALAKEARRSRSDVRDLLVVALTAKVREYGEPPPAGGGAESTTLGAILAETSVGLDPARLHPHMTWRDNVVFGRVDAPNARAEGRIDQLILETLAAGGHADGYGSDLVGIGLGFQVGRGGTRLSGGQRQIVALTRALLRRTPVLVLDEPTSALDPISRDRVAKLLEEWAKGRVVITVSHDPDFVRSAHYLRTLDGGRLLDASAGDVLVGSAP